MAIKWCRNGNENDLAWWIEDEDEERLIFTAYSLIERFIPKCDPWRLGFESYFIQRGMAITELAINSINYHLRRKGYAEIELLETVAGEERIHQSHVSERRKGILDDVATMDRETKLDEIERLRNVIRLKRRIPAYCPTTAPKLDDYTIRFLIDAAPDSATAAWLSAHTSLKPMARGAVTAIEGG